MSPRTVPTMNPPPPANPTSEKTIAIGLPSDFFRCRISQPPTIVNTPPITEATPAIAKYGRTKSGGGTGVRFKMSRTPRTVINSPPTIARYDTSCPLSHIGSQLHQGSVCALPNGPATLIAPGRSGLFMRINLTNPQWAGFFLFIGVAEFAIFLTVAEAIDPTYS